MEVLQDYSPFLLSIYRTITPYISTATSTVSTIKSALVPIMLPLLNKLAVFAQDSPAVITLGLMLLLLIISLQILNFARRIIVFWTRLMFQVLFYGGIVLLMLVIWQRGLGRTIGDLMEWANEIQEVWWTEYRRWEGYQNQAQARRPVGVRNGGGYGAKAGNAGTAWR